MASQRGQYYETQYFHGQNLIIAWVKSFVARANSFLAWANSDLEHGQILS